MFDQKAGGVCILSLLLAGLAYGQGATILFDDFEDAVDGTPPRWRVGALQNGTAKIEGGDFVLRLANDVGLAWMVEVPHRNVSIRTQVRMLEDNSPTDAIGIWGRAGEGDVLAGYWAAMNARGLLDAGVGSGAGSTRSIVNTTLDPVENDVFLQLDLNEDQINLTAWSEIFPRPIEPQISFQDMRFSEGDFLGILVSNFPSPRAIHSPIAFRHFEVVDLSQPAMRDSQLLAGDADRDFDFDQIDLVQVQIAAKYLTGQAATWGEGDWNGAPGGDPENPPAGDGIFDQLDIVAAQQAGTYLAGSYAATSHNGQWSDRLTSVIYDPSTGEVAVDAPVGADLTSINIDSGAAIFTGSAAANLGGSFDNDADNNIFKASFGGSFGSVSFGKVAQTGLSEEFLLGDLSVVGSLAGGGDLVAVDLVYVPEPTSLRFLVVGIVMGIFLWRGKTNWRT